MSEIDIEKWKKMLDKEAECDSVMCGDYSFPTDRGEELTPLQVCKERSLIYSNGFDRTVVEYETDNPRMYTISPYGNFDRWVLDELSERLSLEAEHIFQSAEALISLIETSIEAKYADRWISVEDELPDENEVVIFWLVGKPPEECYHDTSGNPICANSEPYMYECKWGCWSSVMNPSHWQPLPNPPKD